MFDGTLSEIEWRRDRDEAVCSWPPELLVLLLALGGLYLLVGALLPDVLGLPVNPF